MTQQRRKTALVVGATSRIGQVCIQELLEKNYKVTTTIRRNFNIEIPSHLKADLTIQKLHLTSLQPARFDQWMKTFDCAIFIPPVHLAQNMLPTLQKHGVKRLIFVSSYNTYRFAHTPSYQSLIRAEDTILSSGIASIIIQPTMITGHKECPSVRIIFDRSAHKKPFFTVIGKPCLHQPIDFRDLAAAIVHGTEDMTILSGRYPVAGKDMIKMENLYKKTSAIIGHKPLIIPTPSFMIAPMRFAASKFAPRSPINGYLSRLGEDRHMVHDMLPAWSPKYSFVDSLENIKRNTPHSLDFIRTEIM